MFIPSSWFNAKNIVDMYVYLKGKKTLHLLLHSTL